MPNISVIRAHLFESIGKDYSEKEFDELCFEFGVEIDDILTEVHTFNSIIAYFICNVTCGVGD